MDELDALQSAIGYTFADRSLLVQALTHPSYLGEHKEQSSNQRMEYLGDAVLELAVSTYLYSRLPAKAEGELSRIRAAIVSEQPLSVAAREIDLGRYLYLSQGERAGGGAEKASIPPLTPFSFTRWGRFSAQYILIPALSPPVPRCCALWMPVWRISRRTAAKRWIIKAAFRSLCSSTARQG